MLNIYNVISDGGEVLHQTANSDEAVQLFLKDEKAMGIEKVQCTCGDKSTPFWQQAYHTIREGIKNLDETSMSEVAAAVTESIDKMKQSIQDEIQKAKKDD